MRKSILVTAGALCVSLAIWAFAAIGAEQKSGDEFVAKILKTEGAVFVKARSSQQFSKAKPGLKMTGDTYIRTDKKSRAEVFLKNGTMLVLRENTMVLVNDVLVKGAAGRTVVGACYGAVELSVKKLQKNESLEIASPSAVLGVRGTKFTVDSLPDGSVVTRVEEGAVQVDAEGGNALVQPGGSAAAALEGGAVQTDVDPDAFANERREAVRTDPAGAIGRMADRMETTLSNASHVTVDSNNFVEQAGTHEIQRCAMAGMRELSGQIKKANPKNDSVALVYDRMSRIDARYEQIARMIEARLKRVDALYQQKSKAIDDRFNAVDQDIDRRYQEKLKKTEGQSGETPAH